LNLDEKDIPVDKENVIDNIADSMLQTIKLFSPEDYTNTNIVFVIQEKERNIFDQKAIEDELWEKQ
jgi:hypothetical protein